MEQIRKGTELATRKSPYHAWNSKDYKTINAAKRANGLNSQACETLPAVLDCRRKAERRVTEVAVKDDLRRKQRRSI